MMLERLLKRLLPARPPRPGLELADGTPAAPGAVPLNPGLVDVSTLRSCTCGEGDDADGWRHRWPTDGSAWLKAHSGCPRYRPPPAVPDERAVRERLRVAAAAEESAGVVAGPATTAYRQHMDMLLGREGLGLPAHSEVAVLPARVPPNVGLLVVRPWLRDGPVVSGQTAEDAERLQQRLDVMASSKSLMRSLMLGGGANCTAEQRRSAHMPRPAPTPVPGPGRKLSR